MGWWCHELQGRLQPVPMSHRAGEWTLRNYPYVLAGAACVGLAASNGVRGRGLAVVAVALLAAARLRVRGRADRTGGVALGRARASAAGGGAARASTLSTRACSLPRVGEAAPALAVVTGPARGGEFDLRVPATLTRFGAVGLREPVMLDLPVGRSPPQGAIIALRGTAPPPAARVARLRRADVAPPPRRPRRRPRPRLAARRAARRDRRLRRPGSSLARARSGARARGRTARGPRRDRARRGPGPVARPPHGLPRLGPLPPAGGQRPERDLRRRLRAGPGLAARAFRAGSASSARWPGSPRTCSPSARSRP